MSLQPYQTSLYQLIITLISPVIKSSFSLLSVTHTTYNRCGDAIFEFLAPGVRVFIYNNHLAPLCYVVLLVNLYIKFELIDSVDILW